MLFRSLSVFRPLIRWDYSVYQGVFHFLRRDASGLRCVRSIAEIGTISRQAVYDALGMLAEKGIIRRIQPAGSPALYEGRVGDNHHHLMCRRCGKTVDVDCAVGETPCLTAADASGYEIDEAEVIYWGTCPKCLAANRGLPGD